VTRWLFKSLRRCRSSRLVKSTVLSTVSVSLKSLISRARGQHARRNETHCKIKRLVWLAWTCCGCAERGEAAGCRGRGINIDSWLWTVLRSLSGSARFPLEHCSLLVRQVSSSGPALHHRKSSLHLALQCRMQGKMCIYIEDIVQLGGDTILLVHNIRIINFRENKNDKNSQHAVFQNSHNSHRGVYINTRYILHPVIIIMTHA
jgi:hypothetical protein